MTTGEDVHARYDALAPAPRVMPVLGRVPRIGAGTRAFLRWAAIKGMNAPARAIGAGEALPPQAYAAQMHLKWSKGSRQDLQRHNALHAVEPNSEIRSTWWEAQ
jgi:hypothetical protein